MESPSYSGRYLLLGAALLALLAAMWAGLLRLDLEIPYIQPGLSLAHGPLMVCGFLGILISLERSVALGKWWAYAAPVLTALGTVGLIAGRPPGTLNPLLILLGSVALAANFVVIVRRQIALFTLTMAAGAAAWLVGNALWAFGVAVPAMVHWWVGFLVFTIAGERLELSRLMFHSRNSTRWFIAAAGVFLIGLVWASIDRLRGLEAAGLGLLLLAVWLARYDVARRTIRQPGPPRFIAISLLAGYFWLAVGGLYWIQAQRLHGSPDGETFHYDAMLHSIFLGFVFSMIFAHAPIIFPAVLGRPLAYGKNLYVHVILLHVALLLRVGSDLARDFFLFRRSGELSVVVLLLFLLNTAYSLRPLRPEKTRTDAHHL
ncbi:MAG: hypothetical protein HYX72_06300 [Acidobacteria bacterium]|nr:hypothetical protein [Acidobacteriota bacterium]